MPPPSRLAIATSSLNRLVKDEASYKKEFEQQQAKIARLEQNPGTDENAEYMLKQERRALDETKAIFPQMRRKVENALAELQTQLEHDNGPGDQSSPEDITKAKEAVAAATIAIRESMQQ